IAKERDGIWFPETRRIYPKGDGKLWAAEVAWGTPGDALIHVAKISTPAGAALVSYYESVGPEIANRERELAERLAARGVGKDIFKDLPVGRPVISGTLPKGVESQAS